MKRLLGILFVTAFTLGVNAQDRDPKAKAILDQLSEKAKDYTTVQATFDKVFTKGSTRATGSGSVTIKGKKFILKTGEGQDIYSDGRTVWTHIIDSKEVMKCSVEESLEDVQFDPSEMFTIWERDFKYKYDGEETIGGVSHHVIKLFPTKSDKGFHTIILKINKETLEIKQFIIKGKDGSTTQYTLTTFKTGMSLSDSMFMFNKAKHPGVEIFDC